MPGAFINFEVPGIYFLDLLLLLPTGDKCSSASVPVQLLVLSIEPFWDTTLLEHPVDAFDKGLQTEDLFQQDVPVIVRNVIPHRRRMCGEVIVKRPIDGITHARLLRIVQEQIKSVGCVVVYQRLGSYGSLQGTEHILEKTIIFPEKIIEHADASVSGFPGECEGVHVIPCIRI